MFIAVCCSFFILASCQLLWNLFSIAAYNYMGLLTNMASLSVGAIGASLNFEKFNWGAGEKGLSY
jgi:hypothetical protein